ncbi:DUF4238 domain-containing protein [Paradesertivirga mongoliensis]|uniref:DUF4238 domain-containing protein n=1 Tax=Paradesertivirga mongoliensis TaxID=2100740 RepID=A0ABW4ZR16_9SPHI|nr:DUF4238 domain-containing protein [Pedobacter mongoliensis]
MTSSTTDKKNQHYIPKFYLRNFSFEGNQKQLGIYNTSKQFFYDRAPLKNQGSKNFFYGTDGKIEDALSTIEGDLAAVIKEILESKELPRKGSKEHIQLMAFVGLTYLRNPILIANMKNSREGVKKRWLELDPELDMDKYFPEFSHEEDVKTALSAVNDISENIQDLEFKLVINRTKTAFISSDFPIVKYNRFLEMKGWPGGKTGYGNIGLQIFVPLNYELLLIFYDPLIYKVGSRKSTKLEIDEVKSIDSINQLQILNCLDTLFFDEKISKHYIEQLVASSKKYKRANEPITEYGYLYKNGEAPRAIAKNEANIVSFGTTDCETNLEIQGVKIHSGASRVQVTRRAAQLRPLPKLLMARRDSPNRPPSVRRVKR